MRLMIKTNFQCGTLKGAGKKLRTFQKHNSSGHRALRGFGSQKAQQHIPWQLLLRKVEGSKDFCGAVLVDIGYDEESAILATAASCFPNIDVVDEVVVIEEEVDAIAGAYNREETDENLRQVQRVYAIIKHPGYTGSQIRNNVALLLTRNPFEYTETVWPICLLSKKSPLEGGTTCLMSGYSDGNGQPAEHLQEVELRILDAAICRSPINWAGAYNDEIMLCTSIKGRPCGIDFGGALACNSKHGYLFGGTIVNAFPDDDDECVEPKMPPIFIRMSHYTDWIMGTVDRMYAELGAVAEKRRIN